MLALAWKARVPPAPRSPRLPAQLGATFTLTSSSKDTPSPHLSRLGMTSPACMLPACSLRPGLTSSTQQLLNCPERVQLMSCKEHSLQAELVQGHPHPICEGRLWGTLPSNFLERHPPFSFLPLGWGWMATPGLPLCPGSWAVTEPLAGSPRAIQLTALPLLPDVPPSLYLQQPGASGRGLICTGVLGAGADPLSLSQEPALQLGLCNLTL